MFLSEATTKYALYATNIVFTLAGLTIIGMGMVGLIHIGDLQEILPLSIIPIGLIVLGVVILVMALLVCCGAIREKRWMIIIYGVCMVVLVGVIIFFTVAIFNYLPALYERITRWMHHAFYNAILRRTFHVMESWFSCCGTLGPISYQNINVRLPPSCCANPVDDFCLTADAFPGCRDIVVDYLYVFGEAIAIVLIIIIIVQVVAITLAWFFSRSISNKRRSNQVI